MKKLALIVLVLIVLMAYAQGVKITSPKEGETVHGEVPISIEAERGYANVYIDGEFFAAVNLPGTFVWNTNAPYGLNNTTVKDGEHTITVRVYDGQEMIGEAQVKITVKNKVDFPMGEGVKLSYKYKEGEEHSWVTKASREGVDLELQWREICDEILKPKDSPPIILLTNRVESGKLVYQGGLTTNYPNAGKYFFLNIYPNGEEADILSALTRTSRAARLAGPTTTTNPFGWGQLRISFPDKEVKIGEEWESSIIFVADIESGEPRITIAKHKIEDVVYVKNYACFKIKSTYEWRGEISTGTQTGGMPFGMSGMGPGAMPGMGPGAMPGMMMPGMMQGMTRSAGAQQTSALQSSGQQAGPQGAMPFGMMGAMQGRVGGTSVNVTGERTTYFAIAEGKIVKVEEEVKVTPRLGRGETQQGVMPGMMSGFAGPGGMTPGMMPGFMGPGGMGAGSMRPGGMTPGMMPGSTGPGGMPPGMMPGAMGPGGMGPGGMPPGMMPGSTQPGGMGSGGTAPGFMGPGGMTPGMMPGFMGPGGMGPGGMGSAGMGMPFFAGGSPASPTGRAVGPMMAPQVGVSATTSYTLKITSEMIK
ncbi:Ig-like domain-containing protein [bacterium]|nr:Ig-like domain-containing protein [bacterium]